MSGKTVSKEVGSEFLRTSELAKLPRIKAVGPPGDLGVTISTAFLPGPKPPSLRTDERILGSGRNRTWQVTVRALAKNRIGTPPKFTILDNAAKSRRRSKRPVRVPPSDAHRPSWIGSTFQPKLLPLRLPPVILKHRGQRVTPLHIQGKHDNRRVYHDLNYPWSCVCRIISGSYGHGSGVLIGPRHVLTASHIIDWKARWAVVEVLRFDQTFLTGSCATKIRACTEIGEVDHYSNVDEDYAVITIVDRLGDQFGWMGAMTYDSAWDDETWWCTLGYPDDVGEGRLPVFEDDFHLDEDEYDYGEGRAMVCGADLMKGHSGGPIFGFKRSNHLPYVVAVASAQIDGGGVGSGGISLGGENYVSGGSDLTWLINKARAEDP